MLPTVSVPMYTERGVYYWKVMSYYLLLIEQNNSNNKG